MWWLVCSFFLLHLTFNTCHCHEIFILPLAKHARTDGMMDILWLKGILITLAKYLK